MDPVTSFEAEADLPIEQFIDRGNARDRGEELPALPATEQAQSEGGDESEAATSGTVASDKKPDGRTREGRKVSIQREIDELTTAKHTTAREVESAKAELARLQSELARVNGNGQKPEPQRQPPAQPAWDGADPDDPEPTLDAFKDSGDPYSAWMRSTAAWEARKVNRKFYAEAQARTAAAAAQWTWREKLDTARKNIPDFDKRIDPDIPVDTRVMPFIQRHDMAGEIMVYLSEHKDEARALLSLHPIDQIGRIGEIGGVLKSRTAAASNGPAPKAIEISKAKPPTKPLGGSPIISEDDADDSDDTSEAAILRHFERENKRDAKRGR